jgi:hypothetical protein
VPFPNVSTPNVGRRVDSVATGPDLRWHGQMQGQWPQQPQARPSHGGVIAILALASVAMVGGVYFGLIAKHDFSAGEIARVEDTVRFEYARRPGLRVDEVRFRKTQPRRLEGYVKLSDERSSATLNCGATMPETELWKEAEYSWKCDGAPP